MKPNKQINDDLTALKGMELRYSTMLDSRSKRIAHSTFTAEELEQIQDECDYLRGIIKGLNEAVNAISIAYEIA